MEFEWDKSKNKKNIEKHHVDFNDAKKIFIDNNKVDIEINNSLKKYNEKRFITIGLVLNVLHTVIWTLRLFIIRIISFRRSNKKEEKIYKKKL